MKILKYQKGKSNIYKIITDKEEYKLYDDIIVKHSLLLKKEVSENEMKKIVMENNTLASYYEAIKLINIKMRTESELETILKRKGYNKKDIEYTISRLQKEGYINHLVYIEAYIHDRLNLSLEGERKITNELMGLGFKEEEINPFLNAVDKSIYQSKIEKYVTKKLKSNKKSVKEFKRKITLDLVNRGFSKRDIINYLDSLEIEENEEEIKKLINKLMNKYTKKEDKRTAILKIKAYLYQKGYTGIDIEQYLTKID